MRIAIQAVVLGPGGATGVGIPEGVGEGVALGVAVGLGVGVGVGAGFGLVEIKAEALLVDEGVYPLPERTVMVATLVPVF